MDTTTSTFDAIIIGAGPNGLALANYLVKCGQRVLLVERRYEVGGNMITEDFAGARYNLHASYMLLGEEMPPYRDLQLDEHGLSFIAPDTIATLHTKNGSELTLFRSVDQSAKSIAKVSEADSTRFRHLLEEVRTLKRNVILPWLYNAPHNEEDNEKWMNSTTSGAFVKAVKNTSPIEILSEGFGFENDQLNTLLLYLGCMWGIAPRQRGVALPFLFFLSGMLEASMVRGGSYLLAASMYKQIIMSGGQVLEGKEVVKIIVEGDTAKGIELAGGKKIFAKTVVSTLDLKTTFESLLEQGSFADLRKIAQSWKWDPWTFFQAHWTLNVKPTFKSSDQSSGEPLLHVFGYDTPQDLENHLQLISTGDFLPAGSLSIPTNFDSSQAPSGLHVAKFTSLVPYKLASGSWDELKQEFGDKCLSRWTQESINVTADNVLSEYMYPPTYIEMKLANCIFGSINSGAYIPEQLGTKRPSEGISSYRTPIKGLYVCGGAVHPGGMVTLAGGYNAAEAIAGDLGLERWWNPAYRITL